MDDTAQVEALIEGLTDREGGYVANPDDKGGPTCFGITQAVARANGNAGAMRKLPREEAVAIYRRLYWQRPRLDEIATRSARLAAELFDTGVNMGPAVFITFLQRALTALNRNGTDYPDLTPDARVEPATLAALDAFLAKRRLSPPDQLTATEQAIQLDELVKWAQRQHALDPNPPTGSTIQPRPR